MVVKNSESNSRKRISFRDDVFLHVIEIIIQFYSLDFFPLKIMNLYTEMKKSFMNFIRIKLYFYLMINKILIIIIYYALYKIKFVLKNTFIFVHGCMNVTDESVVCDGK